MSELLRLPVTETLFVTLEMDDDGTAFVAIRERSPLLFAYLGRAPIEARALGRALLAIWDRRDAARKARAA